MTPVATLPFINMNQHESMGHFHTSMALGTRKLCFSCHELRAPASIDPSDERPSPDCTYQAGRWSDLGRWFWDIANWTPKQRGSNWSWYIRNCWKLQPCIPGTSDCSLTDMPLQESMIAKKQQLFTCWNLSSPRFTPRNFTLVVHFTIGW